MFVFDHGSVGAETRGEASIGWRPTGHRDFGDDPRDGAAEPEIAAGPEYVRTAEVRRDDDVFLVGDEVIDRPAQQVGDVAGLEVAGEVHVAVQDDADPL